MRVLCDNEELLASNDAHSAPNHFVSPHHVMVSLQYAPRRHGSGCPAPTHLRLNGVVNSWALALPDASAKLPAVLINEITMS